MDYEFEIDKVRNKLESYFLECVNEDCNDNDYSSKIKDLMCYYKNINLDINKVNTYDTNIQTRLNSIEELSFKKPWNKLNNVQKEKKLNDFISSYFIVNNSSKNDIINKIKKSFKENKLNSNKLVNYEPLSSCILDINNLSYNKEKNIYIFN